MLYQEKSGNPAKKKNSFVLRFAALFCGNMLKMEQLAKEEQVSIPFIV
jgi:hypothetical protein